MIFETDEELRIQTNKRNKYFVPYAEDSKMKLFTNRKDAEIFDKEVNKPKGHRKVGNVLKNTEMWHKGCRAFVKWEDDSISYFKNRKIAISEMRKDIARNRVRK